MQQPYPKEPHEDSWKERIARSPYLFGSILVHLILFLLIGGVVLIDKVTVDRQEDPTVTILLKADKQGSDERVSEEFASSQDADASTSLDPHSSDKLSNTSAQVGAPQDLIATDRLKDPGFSSSNLPQIPKNLGTETVKNFATENFKKSQEIAKSEHQKRTQSLRATMDGWKNPHQKGTGTDRVGRQVQAEFVCYVANVQSLNSRVILFDENRQEQGPLRNLIRVMNSWSQGRIQAKVEARPIDMASAELLEKMPPFVYFFGSRDFTLTSKEVENIRRYLISGGCVWGDSGLAGSRSRFDIAFRREMKRVIPDHDKPFEVLSSNHPVFGGEKAFFQLKGVPAGMNFRQESIEAIKIDGEIAVLYSPNNYTDLMRVAYKNPVKFAQNEIEISRQNQNPDGFYTPVNFYQQRETYFRNFDVEGSESAFQFSVNVIIHLLTRFEERVYGNADFKAVSPVKQVGAPSI